MALCGQSCTLTDSLLYWSKGAREREGHVTRIHAPSGGQTLLVSPSSVAPRRKSPRAVVCDANLEQETSRLNFEGDFSGQ